MTMILSVKCQLSCFLEGIWLLIRMYIDQTLSCSQWPRDCKQASSNKWILSVEQRHIS